MYVCICIVRWRFCWAGSMAWSILVVGCCMYVYIHIYIHTHTQWEAVIHSYVYICFAESISLLLPERVFRSQATRKFQLPALPGRDSHWGDCIHTRCATVGVLLAASERRAAEVHPRWVRLIILSKYICLYGCWCVCTYVCMNSYSTYLICCRKSHCNGWYDICAGLSYLLGRCMEERIANDAINR